MTDPQTGRPAGSGSSDTGGASAVAPEQHAAGRSEAVFGPFTLRETVIGASVLVIFIGSLLPFLEIRGFFGNLWNASSLFFLGIGIVLPVATAGLLIGRRLGTETRIGSLSVDQFASVVAVLATVFFFLQTVTAFHIGPLVCLIGAIGMFVATVGGPHLPMFAADFAGRPSASAHVSARRIVPTTPKPKTAKAQGTKGQGTKAQDPKPVPAEQVTQFTPPAGAGGSGAGSAGGTAASRVSPVARGGATAPASTSPPRFADEDFAPYSTSPDTAGSSGSGQAEPARTEAAQPHQSQTDNSQTDNSRTQSEPAAADQQASAAGVTTTTAADATAAATAATTAQPVVQERDDTQDSISATKHSDDDAPVVEAFWFAVGTPRPVVDEASGVELFVLRPGDWEVGIEDRGDEFLVQDKRTGRIGVMRDLTNIERAPSDG